MSNFWSEEETKFLEENWGVLSNKELSKKLNKSINAIYSKKKRLRLCNLDEVKVYITVSEVANLLKVDRKTILNTWQKRGLTIHKNKIKKGKTRINFNTLITFLKNNKDLWNSNKLEKFALGKEYKWLKMKRIADKKKIMPKKWTKYEEMTLINLVKKGKSTKEIKKEFSYRTGSSIDHKLTRMGLTKNQIKWKKEEIEILIESDKKGLKDKEIAYLLGREKTDITNKRLYLKKRGLHPGKEEIYMLYNNGGNYINE